MYVRLTEVKLLRKEKVYILGQFCQRVSELNTSEFRPWFWSTHAQLNLEQLFCEEVYLTAKENCPTNLHDINPGFITSLYVQPEMSSETIGRIRT